MPARGTSARALAACWLLTAVRAARAIQTIDLDSTSLQAPVWEEHLPHSSQVKALTQTRIHLARGRSISPGREQRSVAEEQSATRSDLAQASELTVKQAGELLVALAEQPAEAADEGRKVLAAKARIGGRALVQATQGVAVEIGHGDLAGAWKAASAAVEEARRASSEVDRAAGRSAAQGMGILAVFLIVSGAWGLEFLLTQRADEKTQEEHQWQVERELPSEKNAEGAPFFHGLSFLRLILAWHVVLNNFYRRGDGEQSFREGGPLVAFARWGEFACPTFFLLSGFSNTYSKLVGPKADVQEDWFLAMVKRVLPWYLLYACCLTWCALRIWSINAEDWTHYMAGLLLIDGVIFEPGTFPFLRGSWWLCFLMVYMVIWFPMYQVLSNSTNSVIWTLFTISTIIVIPSMIMEWYFMDMAFFAAIQYWPSFVFGQALATWFVRNCMTQKAYTTEQVYVMRPVHELPIQVRFGPTFSFLFLGIVFFCCSPYDKVVLLKKPIAPLLLKGGLLPLQGILIAGLACEVDPVAKLFARKPFRWGDKLALTTFILQTPIHNTIQDWTGWHELTWTFSAALFVASVIGHWLVERPWRSFLGMRQK